MVGEYGGKGVWGGNLFLRNETEKRGNGEGKPVSECRSNHAVGVTGYVSEKNLELGTPTTGWRHCEEHRGKREDPESRHCCHCEAEERAEAI